MSEEKDIGALWIKDGKSGKFMSGKITVGDAEVPIVIFRNTHKEENSKQPDYRIYKQRPIGDAKHDKKEADSDIPF